LAIKSNIEKGNDKEGEKPTDNSDSNFLIVLSEITSRKWIIDITIKINNEFTIDTTTLFDTGVDLNCIRKRVSTYKIFSQYYRIIKVTKP